VNRTADTLGQVVMLAPGSTLAMTFLLPLELADPEERLVFEAAAKGARASGTPFISFYSPPQMLAMAREAGFKYVDHVSAANLTERYFANRSDGLRPGSSEAMLSSEFLAGIQPICPRKA
jgi:hypothetical protein